MNKKTIHSLFQDLADTDIPSNSVDIWSGVKNTLKKQEIQKGQILSKEKKPGVRTIPAFKFAAALAVLVAAFAVFLFATPQGKVMAEEFLQFFNRSGQNFEEVAVIETELEPAIVDELVVPPSEDSGAIPLISNCGSTNSPQCSVEDIQPELPFTVVLPSGLPGDMQLDGATIIPGGILIRFSNEKGSIVLIERIPDPEEYLTWKIGKDAEVINVLVHNQSAEFVQGSWTGMDIERETSLLWNQDIPARTLRWKDGDVLFTLVSYPHKVENSLVLDIDSLVELAESMESEVEIAEKYVNEGISMQEAEQQAGFSFVTPTWLPPAISPVKTTYNSGQNAICQYYKADLNDTAITMVIGQSNWALPAASQFKKEGIVNEKPVDVPMYEEIQSIDGADNNTGLFLENGIKVDTFCGGDALTSHRALLWQQGDRTFAVFAEMNTNDGRGFVTRYELQRLAEYLNGVNPAEVEAIEPDPERLRSRSEAETVSGINIKLPATMLTDMRLSNISITNGEGKMETVSTMYTSAPVGDGRMYHLVIHQTPNSSQTLEQLRLAGGYHDVTVQGNPGIYQSQCWMSNLPAEGETCHHMLTWFEGGTQFDVFIHTSGLIPEEIVLAIAESMQ